MQILPLIVAFSIGSFGTYLGYCAFKNFRYVTRGEVSLKFQVVNSISAGMSGALIFFSIVMVMGFLDELYIWTFAKVVDAVFISFIPGLIIAVGSFVQSALISGYKRKLHEVLRQNDRSK